MISQRLLDVINALPLHNGIRVIEIGCGSGSAAREIVSRLETGQVLAIDRSAKAIQQAIKSSQAEIASGRLRFLHATAEHFTLPKGERLYDIAFAVRVGSLDGRHPDMELIALENISRALTKKGRLFIDTGNPLQEISLQAFK